MEYTERLSNLSPFELKDVLIQAAKQSSGNKMRNAGRGNPNFLATIPREGYFEWGQFALQETERSFSYFSSGLGGLAQKSGIEARFESFLQGRTSLASRFLKSVVSYVRDQLGYSSEDFIFEMTHAILGEEYPDPDRMLALSEKIVKKYICKEMGAEDRLEESFDLFATEGGAAAMGYLFNTLAMNHLLRKGDMIAIGTPIFTPYLEIPYLHEYELLELGLEATSDNLWQYSNDSLDKLLDPKVKAFFLVNPSNPSSVKMSSENLKYLSKIIEQRPDLIVLTDDVYGTFADNFRSVFAVCPQNTILVYSFSKYFGSTGWRLGVIATSKDSTMDHLISKESEEEKNEMNARYASITPEPERLKFIDRVVADSRAVALNHVAGLSTPAQVQMVLFSLFALIDTQGSYKQSVKDLVRNRLKALYRGLGVSYENNPDIVGYYDIIEIASVSEKLYGRDFQKWLEGILKPNEILFRLANEFAIVLLPASGFGASGGGLRVSLANLNEYDCLEIGKAISGLLEGYHKKWENGDRDE